MTGALSEVRALVVDDSPFMCQLMSEMLKGMGVGQVHCANNGREAAQMLRGDHDIDIAFVDWLMEPVNGMDFLKALRRKARGRTQRLPIIACTAYTDRVRVMALRDNGVHEVLTKPVSPAALYDKLTNTLFNSRLFVFSDNYIGPDRRRRNVPISFKDRRASGMEQIDIDEMFN